MGNTHDPQEGLECTSDVSPGVRLEILCPTGWRVPMFSPAPGVSDRSPSPSRLCVTMGTELQGGPPLQTFGFGVSTSGCQPHMPSRKQISSVSSKRDFGIVCFFFFFFFAYGFPNVKGIILFCYLKSGSPNTFISRGIFVLSMRGSLESLP
jgi:hypothetical protein